MMDIDRLHDVLGGRLTGRGAGRTTAMLTLALQNADFSDTPVVILAASGRHTEVLVEDFCRIAESMGYVTERSGYATETLVLGDDEVLVYGDNPKPTLYKFMPFNLPDKIWLRERGQESGLAVWDHFAVDVRKFFERNPKVGANTLCPCGSGLRFKDCHAKFARKSR